MRMPLALVEPEFVTFLGTRFGSVRALHHISFLSRLNSVVEEALDRIINGTVSLASVSPQYFALVNMPNLLYMCITIIQTWDTTK